VMVASVISMSLDVSVEIVGSSFLRVILIGSIFVETIQSQILRYPRDMYHLHPMMLCLIDEGSELHYDHHHPLLLFQRSLLLLFYPHHLDIPIGRPYRTHPGRPCKALTVRKSVRPLPSYHLALRYTSHHLDHFTFGSSSSHSSSDHSSSGHSSSGHSLSGHTPPDTTIVDSSTPPIFVHPSLARTPRCSEAYLCWRSAPLSTMYPPTTSESSVGDSSFELSAGPYQDGVEEDVDTDVLEDMKADATAIEVAVDKDVKAGIDACIGIEVDVGIEVEDEAESSDRGTMEVGVDMVAGIDICDGMLMPDAVEHLEQVEEGLQDIYDHVIEIPIQRIKDIKTGQRELVARSMTTGGES
nr:hypothetical protein [Tanacetum cinerariifolium]